MAAPYGTPIYAAAEGDVLYWGPAQGFGNWIVLQHPGGIQTVYGHMAFNELLIGPTAHVTGRPADRESRVRGRVDRAAPALRGARRQRAGRSGGVAPRPRGHRDPGLRRLPLADRGLWQAK